MATELLVGRTLVPHQADSWFLRVGGYGFELLVADTWASFNEPSHAVNFAGYLFRQGRERPNDLTHLNEVRWLGYSGGADGRDGHARTVMTSTATHLAATWEGWSNEVLFFLPPRPAASADRLPISAYGLMWDVLDELCEDLGIEQPSSPAGSPDLWVSHLDQATPPHLHRTHGSSRLRLFELVEEAVRVGRISTPAGPLAPFITKS